jgi:elongation factor G
VNQVPQYKSDKIRNVVLVGHSGAGKTSIAESMLFDAGAISRLGKVADGTTTSDYDPEEIKRKISINLSLLPLTWKETKFNFIDTPGYLDFVAEVKAGLAVSDGAVIVVCAVSGVEVGTEQVWEYANNLALPRLIFVNKMDRENVNFYTRLKDIQAKLGTKCIPIQLPLGSESSFQGVIDLTTRKAYSGNPLKETEIPSTALAEVNSYRDKMIEAIVEFDDALLSKYLEGTEISEAEIYQCIKQATKTGKLAPILLGSGLMNSCITPLMDAAYNYLPSPKQRGAIKVINISTKADAVVEPESESPLTALVFKTILDPHVGKISYFRVYSGVMPSNSQVWNVSKSANERIGQLSSLRGKTQESITEIHAGDIGTIVRLTVSGTGDTLGLREHPVKIAPIEFPEPVVRMAVHPKSKVDLDRMSTALPKLTEEDLTLKLQRDPDVGEILLCGMGETHLDVASERLSRKFGAEVKLELPKVPYKETITMKVESEYKHKKQTGGHGQYGHVILEVEPLPKGSGFEFTERVVGGSVPRNFIPAVEKGVNEAKIEGILGKFPTVDIRVTLLDGSSHPVDSSEMAFKIAAAQAFKKGLSEGKSVLLEPIANITITVPDSFTGDIMSDLNSKRGRVLGMTPQGGINVIQAQAPVSEIQRYAITLRSITQGRGTFTSGFSHYEEVPPQITQKIIAQQQQTKE